MWQARIYVRPKEGILDPEGKAIQGGLKNLGYDTFTEVRAGKFFQLRLKENIERGEAEKRVFEICDRLLSNPMIEDYTFELEEVSE